MFHLTIIRPAEDAPQRLAHNSAEVCKGFEVAVLCNALPTKPDAMNLFTPGPFLPLASIELRRIATPGSGHSNKAAEKSVV